LIQQKAVGFDYKSDGLLTSSDGETVGSPKYYRKGLKKQAKLQRQLSRKTGSQKGDTPSKNYLKAKQKYAKHAHHVTNQRKDFLHKLSREITNRYDIVCVEDLDFKAMSNKGFGNGKATLDNGAGMLYRFLEYKLSREGKIFLKVDKWFPSSQMCSCCGHREPALKDLSVRSWTCPSCGSEHDRDINAARNILNEGLRMLDKAA